jgi:hypothetical protein
MRSFRVLLAVALTGLFACSSPTAGSPPSTSNTPTSSSEPPVSGGSATPTPARAPTQGTVGYLGCSLTWQTVDGYHLLGGQRMWPPLEGMGEGDIPILAMELSAPPAAHWDLFGQALARYPATAFWVEACFLTSQIGPQNVAQAELVIAHIRELVPGAKIYLSPMNGWDPADGCGKASSAAVATARRVTDAVVADGVALRGPTLPILPEAEALDSCHPDKNGRTLLAGALLDWLGG